MVTRSRHARRLGFTLTEVMVAVGIIGLVSGAILYSFGHTEEKKRKVCINNMIALHTAINNFGRDMSLRHGQRLTIYQLAPHYIRKADLYKCPSCDKIYGTNFFFGRPPVCPGGFTNHVWNPTDNLKI